MSKVAGFIIGGLEIIAGAILTFAVPGAQSIGISLIISGAAMIVTQAIVDLTMPHAPARQASEMQIALGEQPRSAFFGEGFTAGSLVDAFDYGGKYGTDWEVLIIRLADHRCDSLTSFLVNDISVNYTGDGTVSGYNGQLQIFFRSDTTTQALPAIVTQHGPHWTSGDRGESGCDVIVAYKADDPESENPVWPGGRPRFGFVLKGKLCYDPRLDSTVTGGSGSHRWDDPTTWEWSENPAVCRYNWARGIYANDDVSDPSKLLVGRGLTEAEAPPENIFAAANVCDEDPGDGSTVRYRIAGPVYANQEHLEVEEMFAHACAGTVLTSEGSVELEPGQAKSVTMTFTDDDIVVGSKVSWNEGFLSESNPEWANTIVARYVEPDQKWNDFAAPVVRSFSDIITDGKPREASITLRLVKDQKQALRIAEINRRLARLWGRAQVTLGPRFCETEEGDWIHWQSDRRFGGATKTFRVEAYQIDEKWQNQLTLREINSDVFGEDPVEWTIVDTVDIDSVTNASNLLADSTTVGITLNGFDPEDIVRVSLPTGELYTAWNYQNDGPPDRWITDFDVVPDGVTADSFRVSESGISASSGIHTGGYSTAAAARAAFSTQTFTGHSSYTFWIMDSTALGGPATFNNTGGVSVQVERGRITSSMPDDSEVNPTVDPPVIGTPDGANWTLAAVTVTDNGVDRPALEITGDATDDPTAETIIFEYWQDDGVIDPVANPGDPTWIVYGNLPRATTKVDITGIEGVQDYYAAVTYVVSGFRGDRLVLGPVTAGSTDISDAVNTITGLRPWKAAVRAKTTAALAANTYANGSSGVGATLTGNANGALASVDGVTLVANDRVLVDHESSGSHNGIYVVTQVGDASHPYILTRDTDADSGAELVNATVKVSEGTTFADQEWQCTNNATITVGTTVLVWARSPDIQKLLDTISSTQGAILYRSSSSWLALATGSSGQFLKSLGAGADVAWDTPAVGSGFYEAGPPATVPSVGSLTWVNQGTSTASNNSSGIVMVPQQDGNVHLLVTSAPTAPYDIYVRAENIVVGAASTTTVSQQFGIVLRDGPNGDFLNVILNQSRVAATSGTQTFLVAVDYWTSPTTFSTTPLQRSVTLPIKWLHVNVTSTTVTVEISQDGRTWLQLGTETIATRVGSITQYGISVRGSVNNSASSSVFSYVSTTAPS